MRTRSAPARRLIPAQITCSLILLISGCAPPSLNAVQPDTGYPRQLLMLDGSTIFARLVWDVGLPTEQEFATGFLGTRYFQVPETATAGAHPVALRNSQGTSAPIDVTVLPAAGAFPAPRIEDVGVFGLNDDGTGNFDVALTVSAANLDTDATVTVNGAAPALSLLWGGLPIDYQQAHDPTTYGYPVYHYAQQIVIAESVAPGSTVTIELANGDGLSDSVSYTLPASMADLDSDGDGLLNDWEQSGFTAASGGTVDLPSMGVNFRRKDILVETDWVAVATPNVTIWPTIENAFAEAPVLNPDGSAGINFLVDRGQGAPFDEGGEILAAHTTMDFAPVTPTSPAGYASFFDYKSTNFNPDRLNLFHYCIFGRAMPGGFSGRGEIWGNDHQVTFATFGNWGVDLAEVGTFIHELGHNLGLRHGGIDNAATDANVTFKPNFASTMSYRWQFPGVSLDCDWASEGVHTYSQGVYRSISENNVDETAGICDSLDLDMNGDGATSLGASIDFTGDGDTNDTVIDYDQWGNLLLNFRAPGSRWNNN